MAKRSQSMLNRLEASAGGRGLLVLAALLCGVALALGLALGWLTDGQEAELPRAVPLAATPAAVEIARLPPSGPLPQLRAAAVRPTRARPPRPQAQRTRRAARPVRASRSRRRAPEPVLIVGSG